MLSAPEGTKFPARGIDSEEVAINMEGQGEAAAEAEGGNEDADATTRGLSDRVARSLKDVDRLINKSPEVSPQQKAMLQLEQAKISALLELATAIRANGKGAGPQT